MVFLSPSSTESAFIFSTDDGSDAYVLDIKGIYALVDGGAEPLGFTNCLRTPSASIVSSAAPSGLINAREMNKQPDSLVAVIGNLPSAAALKDAAAAEPLRELYKTLSLPPVVAQLKGAKPEPLVIHKGLSSGTLSVYTLAGDAKDAEAVAKAYQSGTSESIEAAAAAASSVLLMVWQPVREDAPIKRVLHLGSAPLPRIQQALDRARALPFLQSATASAASLKAKPAAGTAARPTAGAAAPAARPAARAAPAATATAAAKPAARAAPTARPAASLRAPPTSIAAVPKSSSARASMPARPAAAAAASGPAASSAARPARASTATSSRPTAAAAAPAARAAARPTAGGAGKEEVAKKTIVSKSAAAPSSARASPSGTASSRTPVKGAAAPSSARKSTAAAGAATAAAGAAVATVAATTVVAAAALSDPTPVQHEDAESAAAAPAAHPSISVSIDDMDDDVHQTPGGLPVPASPTIIPATPQPPMSPEPMDEDHHQEEHVPSSPEPSEVSAVDVDDKWLQQQEQPAAPAAEEPKKEEADVVPSAPLEPEPTVPSAPILEPAASVDEPECVKELVEEEPEPDHKPALPTPGSDDVHEDLGPKKDEEVDEDPYKPALAADEEPEPTQPAAPAPTPVDPSVTGGGAGEVGDLLGDFGGDQPQQPGDDGLLDSLEEPMKKMQISMDTDKLAEELGLTGDGEQKRAEGECSLLDLTQESTMDTDLEKTQNSSVVESAHEYDDYGHLSPVGGAAGDLLADMQRKLSQQAEESLLTAAADPFIAGLASTVVEAATIDGAKSTLESLISNSRGVESPTGDKLLSFRSSGYENPDEPKEVKYEETDPAIDEVLTKLADESDMVNGALRNVKLNGHGDSTPSATTNNGHLSHPSPLDGGGVEVHGNGWPEGTTMHLPAPSTTTTKGAAAGKFKLAGPVHVDMVTVPHRGKHILLTDEAASIEFFSSVRSSIYLLQTGGDVPVHVLDGWKRGKGAWAANVPSRLIPTHHNETVARWAADNQEELAEIGLTVATPVDLTTLTYPDGQAKACTVVL
uniref:Maph-1.3 n=1 Tax=Pristionchus pacificus TaxID=54126 RepID=A0A8R1U867_PRIPA